MFETEDSAKNRFGVNEKTTSKFQRGSENECPSSHNSPSQSSRFIQYYHSGNNSYYYARGNNSFMPQPEHQKSFHYQANNTVFNREYMAGNYMYGANNMVPQNTGNYAACLQHVQYSTVDSTLQHGGNSHQHSQEEADKLFVRQWLEKHHLQSTNVMKPRKTLQISEAKNLFHRYLSLNNQLTQERDELVKKIESDPDEWNGQVEKASKTKEELKSLQNIMNDPSFIQDFQEKIQKRKQKRLWLKNRRRHRYFEKREEEEQRKDLDEKIDEWRKEIRKKDIAARKAASLKHEAGGVLGEVRRKLHDCHKLQELIKSLVKLRELRMSEREKNGIHPPKTSSSEDSHFTTRCEYVNEMVRGRIGNYEEEEKALRVIIMEEKGEREKKEEQKRLEEKALLNLSKELDPLAQFHRYYKQADESIEYLVQIRREWDMYLSPDMAMGERVPQDDVTAAPPTSDLWAAFLQVCEHSHDLLMQRTHVER